jgi:hypothetical protein
MKGPHLGEPAKSVGQPAKCCPRCRSDRVHRSHKRMAFDHFMYALGAEIRRCRDCRFRHASFIRFAVPLGEPQTAARRWTGILVMASGFLVCLLFVWWVIRRFTELSG